MNICPDIMVHHDVNGSRAHLRLFGFMVRVPYVVMQAALHAQIWMDNKTQGE